MSPAEREDALEHWRELAVAVLTAARAALEDGRDQTVEAPGRRAVIVLEDAGPDEVTVRASLYPSSRTSATARSPPPRPRWRRSRSSTGWPASPRPTKRRRRRASPRPCSRPARGRPSRARARRGPRWPTLSSCSERLMPSSPPWNAAIRRPIPAPQGVQAGGARLGARRQLGAQRDEHLAPLALGVADRLVAELLLAARQVFALLVRVVLLHPLGHLDRSQDVVHARALAARERVQDPGQRRAGAATPRCARRAHRSARAPPSRARSAPGPGRDHRSGARSASRPSRRLARSSRGRRPCGLPTFASTLNSRIMRSTSTSRCSSPMPAMIVWPVLVVGTDLERRVLAR